MIEDAAHAAGTEYRGRKIGSSESPSDAVCFSFYATKNLTTGEGGMITVNAKELADRVRMLTLHGINKDAWNRYREDGSWYYEVLECGFKYNLSDLQSAVGIHQLRKLENFTERRARYAEMYNEAFRGMGEIEVPEAAIHGRHAWHLYALRLNLDELSIDRARFIAELAPQKYWSKRALHSGPASSLLQEMGGSAGKSMPPELGTLSAAGFSALISCDDGRRSKIRSAIGPQDYSGPRQASGGCRRGVEYDCHERTVAGERTVIRTTALFLACCLAILPPVSGQEVNDQPIPAAKDAEVAPKLGHVPAQSDDVIGPDDSVTISVLESDEISRTWRVDSSGNIQLPLVGQIHAAGLTADQLAKHLTQELARYIRDPHLTVYIAEFRSQPVTVTGAVHRPGTFQTEGPKTLWTVLTMAGGLEVSYGSTVTVTRQVRYGLIPLPEAHLDADGTHSSKTNRRARIAGRGLPGALSRGPSPRRGPGGRRQPRHRPAPPRPGVLGAAPAPEGGGGGARRHGARGHPPTDVGRRRRRSPGPSATWGSAPSSTWSTPVASPSSR